MSLFAGVGGIDLALSRAGIPTVAAVEIDPAARGVYTDHYPNTTMFNDIREVTGDQLRAAGFVPGRGIIAAGWPCQGNSVAGRREGMDDPRSGLWRHVVRLLAETRPRWFLGENVPGLLSVNGGRDIAVVRADLAQLGYWWAERILDAQHFGVPQRRRRVIIVGHSADQRGPVQVLLEPNRRSRNTTPRRPAGSGTAPVAALCVGSGGGPGAVDDATGGRLIVGPLQADGANGRGHRVDAEGAATGHLVVSELTTRCGATFDDHQSGQLVPVVFDLAQVTHPENRTNPRPGDPAGSLASTGRPHVAYTVRADPGGVGQGHNTTFVPIGGQGVTHALTADGHDASEDGSGRETPIVAFSHTAGVDLQHSEQVTPTIKAGHDTMGAVATPTAVRRLSPTECERLMGLPDGWTATSDGRAQTDSPRYRQLGNSVAVPVLEWVARRIAEYRQER